MSRRVFKFFAIGIMLNLCLALCIKPAYGQCGADGTQPCPGAAKKVSKSNPPKKTSSKKKPSQSNSKKLNSPEKYDGPDYSFIIPEKAEYLLKQTLFDIADAIEIEDFTKLRDKSADTFQAKFTPEQVRESFKNLIDNKEWTLPAIREIKNKKVSYTYEPTVRAEDDYAVLTAKGYFDALLYKTEFEAEYLWANDRSWRLAGLKVSVLKQ